MLLWSHPLGQMLWMHWSTPDWSDITKPLAGYRSPTAIKCRVHWERMSRPHPLRPHTSAPTLHLRQPCPSMRSPLANHSTRGSPGEAGEVNTAISSPFSPRSSYIPGFRGKGEHEECPETEPSTSSLSLGGYRSRERHYVQVNNCYVRLLAVTYSSRQANLEDFWTSLEEESSGRLLITAEGSHFLFMAVLALTEVRAALLRQAGGDLVIEVLNTKLMRVRKRRRNRYRLLVMKQPGESSVPDDDESKIHCSGYRNGRDLSLMIQERLMSFGTAALVIHGHMALEHAILSISTASTGIRHTLGHRNRLLMTPFLMNDKDPHHTVTSFLLEVYLDSGPKGGHHGRPLLGTPRPTRVRKSPR